MGSIHTAACDCGFSKEVTIGSGRQDAHEHSHFPFYCPHCGLVEINVAKLPDDCSQTTCPCCGAAHATQYGTPFVSDTNDGYAVLQWGPRWAGQAGHLCPECLKRTLTFSHVEGIFD